MKHKANSLFLWTSLLLPIGLQVACGSNESTKSGKTRAALSAPGEANATSGTSTGKLGLLPQVEVGPTRYANKEILIDAVSTDAVSWSWEQLAGPGIITFSSPDTEDTSVEPNRLTMFSYSGTP